MSGIHYQISEAANRLHVENHVLRYWEDFLGMDIPRNEKGHRYYTEVHIKTFLRVKELKEKGLRLKEIKRILPEEAGFLMLPDEKDTEEAADSRTLSSEQMEILLNVAVYAASYAMISGGKNRDTTRKSDVHSGKDIEI